MRSVGNRAIVAAGLILAGLAGNVGAQEKPTATQTQPAAVATRAVAPQPAAFRAKATLGPALSLPRVSLHDVQGIAWDGTSDGLWIVLRQREEPAGRTALTAVLFDPATGREKTRLEAPTASQLLGHDGVGLWFGGENGKPIYRRIRTAPELSHGQQARDWQLPEDMPSQIDFASFRKSSGPSRVSVCSLFMVNPQIFNASPDLPLQRVDLDLRTITVCGYIGASPIRWEFAQGAGYVWFLSGLYDPESVSRLALTDIAASDVPATQASTSRPRDLLDRVQVAGVEGTPLIRRFPLAWDGQQLWSLSDGTAGPDQADGSTSTAPLRLVKIDVGLSRKPDTDARYRKALAFERKNGTLKALPLFEELIAYDPAAVEIRNHVGWALGTRPREPYHDLQRAKKLVEGALEWQPWDPEKWDTLAEIYWRMGDEKLAQRLEAKAINLNPTKTFYWRQLEKFRTQPGNDDAPEPNY